MSDLESNVQLAATSP